MPITVVEHSSSDRAFFVKALSAEGFQVVRTRHVDEVRAATLVLLSADAAKQDVIEAVRALKLRHPEASVVVATERDDVADRLACYAAGADDCICAPFHAGEVAAKLRALQRLRSGAAEIRLLADGDAVVDAAALELRVGERAQSVTKREAELLAILARSEGEPVPRERVLREAWGGPAWMTNNSVDVYVGYVRRKLDLLSANVTVKTVRGQGFQIVRRKSGGRAEAAE